MLEAASQDPIVVLLERNGSAHALAGYRAADDEPLELNSGLGILRRNLTLGDIVLFETTGAVTSDAPVGAESREERLEGEGFLAFADAVRAAETLVTADDVQLTCIVDVRALRSHST